jgi:two-component system chemotaxis response regulator CheB
MCSAALAGQEDCVPSVDPDLEVVVVAASAGGLQPLRTFLSRLPASLPAALLVVLHVPATGGRALPGILDRAGPLHCASAVDGEPARVGRVYVAPPDRHLLLVKDSVRLSRGPRQNGLRPAADPLFRSAALHAGPQTTAVVLSGTLDDAALGSATVERRGGRVLVQDPAEADYDSMPRNAIAATEHAVIAPVADLAKLITEIAMKESPDQGNGGKRAMAPARDTRLDAELESELAGMLAGDPETDTRSRAYSGLTCPECGGPLYTGAEHTFDCLVGHRWSPQSLFEEQSSSLERALWLAVRALDERRRLAARLAGAAQERGHPISANQFAAAAGEAGEAADAIREVVGGMVAEVDLEPGAGAGTGAGPARRA